MSEKITFRELIESIAEETDNSKQFTHDFIKDFVDVINGGLKDDGKVNIAGFGKFKLRRMDERQGYNPQTEEKMTIPAHNKIVFKPYKDLRELVNAPYSHLEPTLIEKKYKDKTEGEAVREDTDTQQDDFIPTAPPTSHQATDDFADEEAPFDLEDEQDNDQQDDAELLSNSLDPENEEGQSKRDSFSLDEERLAMDQDDDIVEFNADKESQTKEEEKSEEENYLDEFVSPIEPTKADETETADEQADEGSEDVITENEETETVDETEKSSNQEVMTDLPGEKDTEQHEDPFALDFDSETDEKEKDDDPAPAPSFESKRPSRKRTSKLPLIAAAAVVLLIVAAGAWYFSTNTSPNKSSQMAVSESKSAAKSTTKNNSDQQLQPADNNTTSAATQRAQNQPAKATPADPAPSSTNLQKPSTTDMQIEDGETLWSIAEERYGNPRLWPWIYGTDGSLQNPDMILAGKSLTVPLPSGSQNILNSADSVYVAKGFISTYRWYKNNESSKARDHLWAAKSYHEDIRNITDIQIDKADLVYAKRAR